MMSLPKEMLTLCEVVLHDSGAGVEEKVELGSVEIDVGDAAVVEEGTVAIDVGKPTVAVTTRVAPDGGFGWVVSVMTFVITFFLTGFLKSFGTVRGAIMVEFPETTSTQCAWINGLIGTLSLLVSPLTYGLVAAYGNGCVVAVGCSSIAVGLGLSYFANSGAYLIGSLGLFMGVGASFVITSAVGCTGKYFTNRKPIAVTIALSGGCVGAMVMPHILSALLGALGLHLTFVALGGIFLLFALSALFVYANPEGHFLVKVEEVPLEDGDDGSQEVVEELPILQTIKRHVIERLALPYLKNSVFLLTAAAVTFLNFGCPHLVGSVNARARDTGVSADDAAWLTLCAQLGDLTARLVYGILASKSPFVRSAEFAVALAVCASCAATAPFCAAYWQFFPLALIGSIAVGVVNISIPLLLSANHGATNMTSTLSLARVFQGMAGVAYRQVSPHLRSYGAVTAILVCNATSLWIAAVLALVIYLKVRNQK